MSGAPNILLVLTDQQSWTMMSCAGNRYLSTPAMDSLAARGTRFNLAFCANPVCSPSRFSLFTGRYSSEIGQVDNYAPADGIAPRILETGLGHSVRAAGYRAVYAGKEHISATHATELGFEYICRDERDELARACAAFVSRPHSRPFFLVASFINPHDICLMALREDTSNPNDRGILERCQLECAVLDRALATAEGIPEHEFWEQRCPPLPPNHPPQEDEPDAIAELLDQRPFRRHVREHWDERKWRMHRWAYHRLTEQVDAQIGVVLDALRQAGRGEDTVVLFTSDHGDHSSSHRLEHKTALYEEATRVPLILSDPAGPAGVLDTDSLVCIGTDLYPTICDYAAAAVPPELTGASFRPAPAAALAAEHDHILIESEFGFGLRTRHLFYVLYNRGRHREQLYDLEIDPGQTRNFIGQPGYADEVHRFRGLLARRVPGLSPPPSIIANPVGPDRGLGGRGLPSRDTE